MALTTTFFSLFLLIITVAGQTTPMAEAPAPAADDCNGIFLQYVFNSGSKIKPTLKTRQPYKFQSILSITNNGLEELKLWRVFVGFQHDEILVSASNALLADGESFPALVGNGTVFAGFPAADLKTAVETAGDTTQTSVQIKIVGTQFGVGSPNVPMPSNISLENDGFICPKPSMQGTDLRLNIIAAPLNIISKISRTGYMNSL